MTMAVLRLAAAHPALEDLLSLGEAAKRLGISKSSIQRRLDPGQADFIPHFKLLGRLRFSPRELSAWLERHHVSGAA